MIASKQTSFATHLRNTLLTFLLFGAVAVVAYGAYSWQREEGDVRENLFILSGFLASASQAFFDDIGNGLEPLGDILEHVDILRHPELARPYLLKFQQLHHEVTAMAVFAPNGAMLINTAVLPGQALPDLRLDPPYLKNLQQDMASTARYTIGPPEFGKAIQRWRFSLRYGVRDDAGKLKFLLQAAIPLEHEGTFLHQLAVPPESYIGLLRADGFQQARWPVEDANKIYGRISPGPAARMILADPSLQTGYFSGLSPWIAGDKQRVGAFSHLPHAAMYAYVSVPAQYLLNRWWRHNAPVFLSFILFLTMFAIISVRVTKREKAHSQDLLTQAHHDSLTELPNRAAVKKILQSQILLAKSDQKNFAVLFLDLDRFKNINDSLGHTIGDELLIAVAQRISSFLQAHDTVGRLGGDEFLILLPDSNNASAVLTTQRLLDGFSAPFQIAGYTLQISPSIGVAMFPEHGEDTATLLKHADTAMYESKRMGRNAYTIYMEQLSVRVNRRLEIENQLREGLRLGQFHLVYQPIVDMSTGRIIGAESLLRWTMPDGQTRLPAEFIDVAEDSGLILALGEWVLRVACEQMQSWIKAGIELRVAVNLSTRQFQDPRLIEKVTAVLRDTGLHPSRLELEITESAAMYNPEDSMRILGALKRMGVTIAIDDFGTGYSSLSHLKRIPADIIKIDKSFVDGLNIEADDTAIVRTIIALADTLEKQTIAEGIETKAQYEAVREMGCDFAQGHWLSEPLAPEAFQQLLQGGLQVVAKLIA